MPCIRGPSIWHNALVGENASPVSHGFEHTARFLVAVGAATSLSSLGDAKSYELHNRGIGDDHLVRSNRFSISQKFIIQVVSACSSSISLLSTLVCFYWLVRMRKFFRHKLIMLIILGDFLKALFNLLYTIIAFSIGPIESGASICQATGFLIHFGTEAADAAIFLVSLHTALQVFRRASTTSSSDGLYGYRYYVYAGYVSAPLLLASLAFINPGNAYQSAGAFCSLPFRPFWYRLALAWVPRYLIGVSILALAIAIYIHVGFEFKILTALNPETSTLLSSSIEEDQAPKAREKVSVRHSGQSTSPVVSSNENTTLATTLVGTPNSNPEEKNFSFPDAHATAQNVRNSTAGDTSPGNRKPSYPDPIIEETAPVGTENQDFMESPPLQTSLEPPKTSREGANAGATRYMATRKQIQRNLRRMFIYPLAYLLMWMVPFASHCMNYNDYYAAHPSFELSTFVAFNLAIMGAVDCLIFSLRERPWHHIPGSDGTIAGSFRFWRHCCPRRSESHHVAHQSQPLRSNAGPNDAGSGSSNLLAVGPSGNEEPAHQLPVTAPITQTASQTTAQPSAANRLSQGRAPVRPHMPNRTTSSDKRQMDADNAYTRLAWEREDAFSRREAAQAHASTGGGVLAKPRQWWDRRESELAKMGADDRSSGS